MQCSAVRSGCFMGGKEGGALVAVAVAVVSGIRYQVAGAEESDE